MEYSEGIFINSNKDIEFNSLGKIKIISMEEKLIQSIKLKLSTIKGDLFYDEDYGINIFNKKINEDVLEAAIRDCIVDKITVSEITLRDFYYNNVDNSVNILIDIILIDNKVISTTENDALVIGGVQ